MVGEPLPAEARGVGAGTDAAFTGDVIWQTGEAIPPELLRRTAAFGDLTFTTSDELPLLPGLVGQERAVEAVEFGIAMQRPGFNVFAFGPHGSGKRSLVQLLLEQRAAGEPVPPDRRYVNNFDDPRRPRCLKLPTGRAVPLRDAMKRLVSELRIVLPPLSSGKTTVRGAKSLISSSSIARMRLLADWNARQTLRASACCGRPRGWRLRRCKMAK